MKTLLAILLLPIACFAGPLLTPRAGVAAHQAGGSLSSVVTPPPPSGRFIVLIWTPAYAGATNVATVIMSSPDITVPREQWPVVYQGQDSTAKFPATNGQANFTAKTVFITSTN